MKIYVVKKAFLGKAVGHTMELDPADATTIFYETDGYIEKAPSAVEEGMIAKAIHDLTASVKESFAKVASDTLGEVNKGLALAGPRIDAGVSEAEKRKSFGRQLVLIGQASNPETPAPVAEQANIELAKVYKSTYNAASNISKAAGNMVESSGPNGGYSVAPEYSTKLYMIGIEQSVVARKAQRIPMSSNSILYPKLDQTDTKAAGQSGYLGGIVAGWGNEGATGNKTQAKLKQGEIKAGELLGYTNVSNELASDNGIGLEGVLSKLIPGAVGYYTDLAILAGDGVDKPMPILGGPATIGVPRTTSNLFKYADGVNMVSRLLPDSYSSGRAFWVFNQTLMPQLFNMADSSGRLIWQTNFNQASGQAGLGMPPTFLGLPYYFTEKTPSLGSAGDAMLIDPDGYLLGDRMGLEIAASPFPYFLQRLMTYRFCARLGGQPMLDKPFTMLNGTTLSHFVTLNA